VASPLDDNPWLHIPAADYEAHMDLIGQAAALRELFRGVYAERRPRRLAILGCTTGSDLREVDPAVTEVAVGVDMNPEYLAIARARVPALEGRLHLIRGDVLEIELPPIRFELVHAALLLEYVDPVRLFRRVQAWLAPDGRCSVVTQEPMADVAEVSSTPYVSLQILGGRMSLRPAAEVVALAADAGLRLAHQRTVDLAGGKRLVGSTFERA
jgi:SAM-dependent methyltransferase